MQSKSETVPAYLKEVPAERQDALKQLRGQCRKLLVGFKESMEYGMPSYSRNGEVEVAFASQKNYISIYILRTDVMKTHKKLLTGKGVSFGKGCIRYTKPERIDIKVVESMLRATEESEDVVC
ncbi:MAG TPA: DUF1801 domain-containing protein [Anaerolineales bacterium]